MFESTEVYEAAISFGSSSQSPSELFVVSFQRESGDEEEPTDKLVDAFVRALARRTIQHLGEQTLKNLRKTQCTVAVLAAPPTSLPKGWVPKPKYSPNTKRCEVHGVRLRAKGVLEGEDEEEKKVKDNELPPNTTEKRATNDEQKDEDGESREKEEQTESEVDVEKGPRFPSHLFPFSEVSRHQGLPSDVRWYQLRTPIKGVKKL